MPFGAYAELLSPDAPARSSGGLDAPTRRRTLCALLLVLLPAAMLAGAWRLGGVSGLEDDLLYYLPVRQYLGERLRAGEFPLWNPWVRMGTSIAADPQSGLWYPPTYLFALLPPLVAYPLTLVLHFVLAGAGMYRFLRASRLDWRAALLGAIAFEFSGFLVAHRVHLTIFEAAAWLPWMLWGWRRFADTGRLYHLSLAALALGLQMLVQHIQVTLIGGALLTAYVAVMLRPRRRSLVWQYPLGMALGAMLATIQLLPTYAQFAGSVRESPAFHLFVENSWQPSSAIMLLFPMFFGSRTPNLWNEPWWGNSHFCEQSAYASLTVLILALASLRLARYRRDIAFWWATCLAALLIALGELTPLAEALFRLPVYRSLRVPARWILVWSVALPVLAATVASIMLRGGEDARRLGRTVRKLCLYVMPAAVAIALLLMALAYGQIGSLWVAFPNQYAKAVWRGLMGAVRLTNPAIWWPLLLLTVTAWALVRWVAPLTVNGSPLPLSTDSPGRRAWWTLLVVLLVDLASVAAFVDVDTRTYTRGDLTGPSALSAAIHQLDPQPGQRLLTPRINADYHLPLEVLWPFTNVRHQVATFHGYGPLWPAGSRLLLRFMPWGSSEAMLGLLRRPEMLRAFGVRFLAVRSEEERTLLAAATWPATPADERKPISDSAMPVTLTAGDDLLWPVEIVEPGIYELRLAAEPVLGASGRMFVRIETLDVEEVTPAQAIHPVDLAGGPRVLRFLFICDRPVGAVQLRVKSERGRVLRIHSASFGRVAMPPENFTGVTTQPAAGGPFVHRADLPDGVSLYELPNPAPLVYWAGRVHVRLSLPSAVDWLLEAPSALATPGEVVIEAPADTPTIAPADSTAPPPAPRFTRPRADTVRIDAAHPTGGLLVFNETFDPGWTATIDDEPAAIVRVNALCQGVRVPAGNHTIEFHYRPAGITWGTALSAVALLLVTSGILSRLWSRRA